MAQVRVAPGFWGYAAASLLVTAGVLYHAITTRKEFYTITIYLVTSKVAISVRRSWVACDAMVVSYVWVCCCVVSRRRSGLVPCRASGVASLLF